MLDKIFNGINLGSGVVGQGGLTGAGVIRSDSRFNSNLANGNYMALANTLNTLSYTAAQNPNLPPAVGNAVASLGIEVDELPLKPETVLAAMKVRV